MTRRKTARGNGNNFPVHPFAGDPSSYHLKHHISYTYMGNVGRGRQWELGSIDDKGDGGHVWNIVTRDHKLKADKYSTD